MVYSRYILPFLAAVALVPGGLQLVQALDLKYCADINTGTTPTNSSIYQSNGLCHDYCIAMSYSFAILQEEDCWCSDYVPVQSSQVDTGKCNLQCPGWPPDTCGAKGLYGYIYLAKVPSGTADASSTATSTAHSTTSSSTTSSTSTSVCLASCLAAFGTSTDTTVSTPNTSLKTLTTSGSISVETVTVTPIPDHGTGESTLSHAPSTGAIVGIVVGVLAGVAIFAGIAVFFFLRSKRRRDEEKLASKSQSYLSGSAGTAGTPTTAITSVWDGENTSTGRRSSRLMPHDPRMDPFATSIYNRLDNKSRESINTLQDNQDYSRKVLRTTNPDPPEN
ncbi:hypothetical protein F4861DRAFT_546838 [Xylaria intraflava]|nr:hypothetical protein F4861DRAFT_546838 [Xylaria intraflava]